MKNPTVATVYVTPIRLWSVVVSHTSADPEGGAGRTVIASVVMAKRPVWPRPPAERAAGRGRRPARTPAPRPRRVVLRRDGTDRERHRRVADSAELGTLAVIGASLLHGD